MPATRKRKAPSEGPVKPAKKSTKSSKSSAQKDTSSQQRPESPPAIVGGPNGDYRISGIESDSQSYKTFTIPAENDKVIPCQLHGPDPKSSSNVKHLLIFTHGAGGGIENPATKLFAEGCASAGMSVLCFQGTMNLKNRVKSFETVLEYCKEQYPDCEFAVGGRSMGARAAVILAGEHEEIRKVVAVSYPLVSPKGELRDEILADLSKEKKVCFLSGDRDNMCDFERLEEVRGKMVAGSKVVAVKNADHGMSLVGTTKEKAKAVEEVRRFSGQFAAQWLRSEHDGEQTVELRWSEEGEVVVEGRNAQEDGIRDEKEAPAYEDEHLNKSKKPAVKKRGRESNTGPEAQRNGKVKDAPKSPKRRKDGKHDEEVEITTTPRRSSRNKG